MREKEGAMFLQEIQPRDFVVALDEKGKKMDSLRFAAFLQEKISYHPGRLVFLIGGFAGFAPAVAARADQAAFFFRHDLRPRHFPHRLPGTAVPGHDHHPWHQISPLGDKNEK